jgi:hypothetical protein
MKNWREAPAKRGRESKVQFGSIQGKILSGQQNTPAWSSGTKSKGDMSIRSHWETRRPGEITWE